MASADAPRSGPRLASGVVLLSICLTLGMTAAATAQSDDAADDGGSAVASVLADLLSPGESASRPSRSSWPAACRAAGPSRRSSWSIELGACTSRTRTRTRCSASRVRPWRALLRRRRGDGAQPDGVRQRVPLQRRDVRPAHLERPARSPTCRRRVDLPSTASRQATRRRTSSCSAPRTQTSLMASPCSSAARRTPNSSSPSPPRPWPPTTPSLPCSRDPARTRWARSSGALWTARPASHLPPDVCCPDTGSRADDGELFLTLRLSASSSARRTQAHRLERRGAPRRGRRVRGAPRLRGRANVPEVEAVDLPLTWLVHEADAGLTLQLLDGADIVVSVPVLVGDAAEAAAPSRHRARRPPARQYLDRRHQPLRA